MTLEDLEALLVVQEHDTALDRLRHRHETLPERDELQARGTELRTRDRDAAGVRQRHEGVLADEQRVEAEVAAVEAHAKVVEQKLYSGATSSPRELQAMQADVDMLRRQRARLEDRELEIMEQREQLEQQLADHDASLAGLWSDVERLQTAITTIEREISDATATEQQARDAAAQAIAPTLLSDYERRRAQNKGLGVARLVGITCQACRLTIPSTEAERIRRDAGAVLDYCDNCGAILVP